jgi:hypothetical protein
MRTMTGRPVLGASYMMVAVKRVPGMRLVGLKRRALKGQRAAAPVVAGRRALKNEEAALWGQHQSKSNDE